MSYIRTGGNRLVYKKPESMLLIPYYYDSSNDVDDYVLGEDVYDITSVIGDSIVLEQGDGNTETKENEFKNTPLLENTTSGKWVMTAQIYDLQNDVLRSISGAMYGGGAAFLPDDYIPMYVLVRVRFSDASTPDLIIPKMLLNSKLLVSQLKTRGGQGNLAGTSFSVQSAVIESVSEEGGTIVNFSGSYGMTGGYLPQTPVCFVPRGIDDNFAVLHHYDEVAMGYVMTRVGFSDGVHSQLITDGRNGSFTFLTE